jgi:hypothetical protein
MLLTSLSPAEQAEALNEAGGRLGIQPLMVEKDFWVCWTLRVLFASPELAPHLFFKGGTSLSMVYGAISRFSEDIDLGIAPAAFGVDEGQLNEAPSASRRQKDFDALLKACAERVQGSLREELIERMRHAPGGERIQGDSLTYDFDPGSKSPNLLFEYPTVLTSEDDYVRKVIKLEFGSLTNQRPIGSHRATTLLERALPGMHEDTSAEVVALELERTFWEKATILHSEAHRPLSSPLRDRTARHYADFASLWDHAAKDAALARPDLLVDVALHKSRFFRTGWASYETAVPGTMRLHPPEQRLRELRTDFAKMRPMFIGDAPTFAHILERIAAAEKAINTAAA